MKENPHPNIVTIVDYYEKDGFLYVIEEYINGKNLSLYVKEEGAFSQDDVLSIMIPISQALIHLHTLEEPIIHRDIKLANIMIDNNKFVKLIDFNVSRIYDDAFNYDTTVLGTQGYAAPEQFGFMQTDARSDIYSCGILMNYLLTTMHPSEFIYQGELSSVIQKCIDFTPSLRYTSAQELYQTLQGYCQKKPIIKINSTKFSLPIPGFRTMKLWKIVIAFLGYALIFSVTMGAESKDLIGYEQIFIKVITCLYLLATVFLYTNFLNIRSRLSFFDSKKWYIQLWGFIIYSFIILLFYIGFVLIITTIFS